MKIPYVNLNAQWHDERTELLPLIEAVLAGGDYVGGKNIELFEQRIAQVCGVQHAIALNSGTDALVCALRALEIGPGDEVITPPNSFVASTAAIVHVGARPVFVDVREDQNIDPDLIEAAITSNTRAIMPVHLSGRIAEMDSIMKIAERYGLEVVEDAAQAVGSMYRKNPSGSFGVIGCFSTHPLKNLNACGDGGFVTVNDEKLASRIRQMRNHGLIDRDTVNKFGHVSRMDSLQAEILLFRLERLGDVTRQRRNNAAQYRTELNARSIFLPPEKDWEFHTYHTFVIQLKNRDEAREFLHKRGIDTAVHYPTPIHLQPASEELGYTKGDFPETEKQAERILTLPINQYLSCEEIRYVAQCVNEFTEKT